MFEEENKGKEKWILVKYSWPEDGYKILETHTGDKKSAEVFFQKVLSCRTDWTLEPLFVAKLALAKLTRKIENVEITDFKIGDNVI